MKQFILDHLMTLSFGLPIAILWAFMAFQWYKAEIIDYVDDEQDDFIDKLLQQ